MRLTYWCAENLDARSLSIVDKTKRGAQLKLDAEPTQNNHLCVKKRTISYVDAFDLMEQLTGAGGGRGYSDAQRCEP